MLQNPATPKKYHVTLYLSKLSLSQFSSKSRVVVEFSECLKRKFPKKQSKEKHTRRILEKVYGVCDRVRWWARILFIIILWV